MMEPSLVLDIIKEAPALAVTVWMVKKFLSHISDMNRAISEVNKSQQVFQESYVRKITDHMDSCVRVLIRNTIILERIEKRYNIREQVLNDKERGSRS